MFGHDVLEKLKCLLNGISSSEVGQVVEQKLESAREELNGFIPASFKSEVQKIEQQITTTFARD